MNRRLGQPGIRRRFRSPRRGPSSLRPLLESLEGRMMLDAGANQDPGDLVLGRTLATPATAAAATPAPCYFVGRSSEQPGDDHLHGLQRAGRSRDRGAR